MKNVSVKYAQQYKDFCKKVKKSARQDKEHWIHDQCEEAEKGLHIGNTRQAYSLIKMLGKKFVP
jgi:ribosomal protein S17